MKKRILGLAIVVAFALVRNIYIITGLFCLMLCACKKTVESPQQVKLLELNEVAYHIDEDELGQIEWLQCNDSALIVFDAHSGEEFTLFNLKTGTSYGRFGQIGQGPEEIPLGTDGILDKNLFYVFFLPTGLVARYHVDSLLVNIHSKPHVLAKYKFDDATLPRICPINDSIFLGAGVYKSEFQYVLFNAANDIMDCKVEIYNARYDWFNAPHKFLSNQGRFKKHPHKNQFVFSLNHSANIDFLEVADNKINVIKLLRQKNPLYKVIQNGEMSMVAPDANCIIGYIDISAGNNYVYALYTDKKATASYSSDKILVYDWEGNLVKEYRLNREAYYITVNETLNKLFAAVRNEDGGWSITSYDMNTKNMIPISPGST